MNVDNVKKAKNSKSISLVFRESLKPAFVSLVLLLIVLIATAIMDDNWNKFKQLKTWRDVLFSFVFISIVSTFIMEYSGEIEKHCVLSKSYYDL